MKDFNKYTVSFMRLFVDFIVKWREEQEQRGLPLTVDYLLDDVLELINKLEA